MTTFTSAGSAGLWIQGSRPRTLALSVTPIAVGLVYASVTFGAVAAVPILAALLSAVLIQVATNLANDAADGDKGADHVERLGPVRLVGSGLAPAFLVRRGAVAASLGAVVFGLIAVLHGGMPILLIGVGSLVAAWCYSYGPWPISTGPFGEVFVILFFGIIATIGIVWLGALQVDGTAVLLGLAIGMPAAAVLTVNNHRDRAQDEAAGRRTLAIVLGPEATPYLYVIELAAGALITGLALWPISWLGVVVAAVAFGFALYLGHRLSRTPISRVMNGMLAATVRFQLGLAAGIIVVLLLGAR